MFCWCQLGIRRLYSSKMKKRYLILKKIYSNRVLLISRNRYQRFLIPLQDQVFCEAAKQFGNVPYVDRDDLFTFIMFVSANVVCRV